jgi:polyisoprenoid-binding protein YceI
MHKIVTGVVSAILLLAAVSPEAWPATYEIDNAHSSVSLKIKHLVSKVRGEFTRFEGTIEFDPEHRERSSALVRIDAASIDTHHAKRDEHLRSADFFDVARFPDITFRTKTVDGNQVIADLTLHGVTREVRLHYSFHGIARDPRGRERAGFSAVTFIDRKDFGITYNKVLDQGGMLIGDRVDIEIEVEAVLKA